MAGNSDPLTPRAKLAVTAGKAVAAASRAAGRGSGSVIGGRGPDAPFDAGDGTVSHGGKGTVVRFARAPGWCRGSGA
ncbi:hypothetical protein [Streptomyces glomeratus]|uniref:hypothetical protein n=1 Tax=Streptomyces glomeratus TaxID=284452 RepID=UPI001F1683C2|nr:hypothetical protein [Streptomyces glomeratus]MCF1509513.1 hypothetical protein [Streptomyces glomeratus]